MQIRVSSPIEIVFFQKLFVFRTKPDNIDTSYYFIDIAGGFS